MKTKYSLLLCALMLQSCASVPDGPSATVLPGTGKSFDQFRYDDDSCRVFAHGQIGGGTANQAAADSFAGSTIVGTLLGTAIGAAAGGEHGAGTGAAAGLFVGSIIGLDEANASSYKTQRHYDNAYIQCMYAKGHRVPVSGHIEQQQPSYRPNQPKKYPPPPPPDYKLHDGNK